MSSRLDRITLSLSSPTFLAFSSPSLARDVCLPVSTSSLRLIVERGRDLCAPRPCQCASPFPSRCKKDLILKRVACAVLLAFPSE